jgi:hypothetical protein
MSKAGSLGWMMLLSIAVGIKELLIKGAFDTSMEALRLRCRSGSAGGYRVFPAKGKIII